jgi:ATP-dependent Clp protease ATP-binding subunit ClpA
MKVRHSDSLILIWRLAELEARQLKASIIEPTHLLLGLCKSVDLDLPTLVQKDSPDRDEVLEELLREVRRLRTIFRTAGLDVRTFRRALRRKSGGNRIAPSESQSLHRSKAAKQVFADAEHFAEMANSVVFPVQLLFAVVSIEDEVRDDLLDQLGVQPERLNKVAKREVAFPWAGEKPSAGRN